MADLICCCCELAMKLCCLRRDEEIRKETERELVAELVAAGRAVTERQTEVRDTVPENWYQALRNLSAARKDMYSTSLGLLPSGSTVQVLSSHEVVPGAELTNCFGDVPPSRWYLEVVPPDNLEPPKKGAAPAAGGNDLSQGMATAPAANMKSSSSGWVRLERNMKYNVAPAH